MSSGEDNPFEFPTAEEPLSKSKPTLPVASPIVPIGTNKSNPKAPLRIAPATNPPQVHLLPSAHPTFTTQDKFPSLLQAGSPFVVIPKERPVQEKRPAQGKRKEERPQNDQLPGKITILCGPIHFFKSNRKDNHTLLSFNVENECINNFEIMRGQNQSDSDYKEENSFNFYTRRLEDIEIEKHNQVKLYFIDNDNLYPVHIEPSQGEIQFKGYDPKNYAIWLNLLRFPVMQLQNLVTMSDKFFNFYELSEDITNEIVGTYYAIKMALPLIQNLDLLQIAFVYASFIYNIFPEENSKSNLRYDLYEKILERFGCPHKMQFQPVNINVMCFQKIQAELIKYTNECVEAMKKFNDPLTSQEDNQIYEIYYNLTYLEKADLKAINLLSKIINKDGFIDPNREKMLPDNNFYHGINLNEDQDDEHVNIFITECQSMEAVAHYTSAINFVEQKKNDILLKI